MKQVYFWLILLLFISCQTQIKKINDSEDIEIAKEFVTKFYNLILSENFDEASNLFENNLDKEKGKRLLLSINETYGRIKQVDIIQTQTTNIQENKIKKIEYIVEMIVIYDKIKCKELITIKLIDNNLRIIGYKSNIML